MEQPFLVTNDNILDFINSLVYGSILVTYDSDRSREKMHFAIKLIDEIFKSPALVEAPAIKEGIDYSLGANSGQFLTEEIPGVFRISFSSRHKNISLSKEDFAIEEHAVMALNQKTLITLSINEGLFKMAQKIGKKMGVKVRQHLGKVVFDGLEKNKSKAQQIKDAFLEGKNSIKFETNSSNPATIRMYASTIGTMFGEKFRCKVDPFNVTVIFRDADGLYEALSRKFEESIDKIGIEATADIFRDVVGFYTAQPEEQPQDSLKVIPVMMTASDDQPATTGQPESDSGDDVVPLELGPDKQFYIPGTQPVEKPDLDDDGF